MACTPIIQLQFLRWIASVAASDDNSEKKKLLTLIPLLATRDNLQSLLTPPSVVNSDELPNLILIITSLERYGSRVYGFRQCIGNLCGIQEKIWKRAF